MRIVQKSLGEPDWVVDRKFIRQFLGLPFHLYSNSPQWVPPLAIDAQRVFDTRQHPFYRHSQAAFFLAYRQGFERPSGRLAILDHHGYNDYNQTQTAFFYLFECEEDLTLSQALFSAAFDWAHQRGLKEVYGPKGFTTLDGLGLLVKGFEHRPALGIPYNPPYYAGMLEAAGFELDSESVSGYLSASMSFPEKIHHLAELIQKRRGLHVRRFKKRRELTLLIPRLKDLYNQTIQPGTGVSPLTEAEARTMANQILWFADPRLIKLIFKGEEPVGFLFAYPDISAALQRNKGRLFPFGWSDVLLELKRTKWININGAGMIEGYQGLGGPALLFSEMEKSVREGGFQHADLVQVGLENDRMQRELRDLGIDFYKKHRLYRKIL